MGLWHWWIKEEQPMLEVAESKDSRDQRVVVSGSMTRWRPVMSGISQGLVLGPVLLNVFVHVGNMDKKKWD